MAKTGRPLKEIDKEEFEKLCEMQCTRDEICYFFGVCEDTLCSWCKRNYKDEKGKPMTFSAVFEQKRGAGKTSLRRAQWKKAIEKEDTTLLIWLGKNMLGQSEKPEAAVDVEDTDSFFREAGLK